MENSQEMQNSERLKNILIDKLGLDSLDEIQDETDLASDLGADSLDVVEIVMEMEKEFDITITDADAESVTTFKELLNLIK